MGSKQFDFGMRLSRLYPHLSQREALSKLLTRYGSYRPTAKAVGVSLATLARWAYRLGASQPPYFPHLYTIRAIANHPGDTFPDKVRRLKEKHGTWVMVAAELNVTIRELRDYRATIGMVPKSSWEERCEVHNLLEENINKDSKESYYEW